MWVVVPAAGIGERFGSGYPKQYAMLTDQHCILEHTLQALLRSVIPPGQIVVALHPEDGYWNQLELAAHSRVITCYGGSSRARSVRNGLDCVARHCNQTDPWVLVHDAARPGITTERIDTLYQQVYQQGACGGLLAQPVHDTVKKAAGTRVSHTISREGLWLAQTPQLFRLDLLRHALDHAACAGIDITDEASAVEALGYSPVVVHGHIRNTKITTSYDLLLVKTVMNVDING